MGTLGKTTELSCVVCVMAARKLQSFTRALTDWSSCRFWLLFCVFIISSLQSAILAFGEIGHQVILENSEQLPGVLIPFPLFVNHLSRLGGIKALSTLGGKIFPLFLVQSIPALVYSFCESLRSKRITALLIWLLPAIISLPTLIGPPLYLMSAVYASFILPELVLGNIAKEDVAEGLTFSLAAISWFHLFWLSITIKNWFLLRSRTDKTI